MKIIADVGSNWITKTDLFKSIEQIAVCGADVAKFQCFSEHDMYGTGDDTKELPIRWLSTLKSCCSEHGVEFMCTFFNPMDLYGQRALIDTIKVASSDVEYETLLDMAYNIGKPVIISTGGTTDEQLAKALTHLKRDRTDLLYCCGQYPSTDHNLHEISRIAELHGLECGYSDHSCDVFTPYVAAHFFDAHIIEKHFKLFDMHTPDNDHALSPKQFMKMCNWIKNGAALQINDHDHEKDFFRYYNRRLVAIKDIPSGERLVLGTNYGEYRSKEDSQGAISGLCASKFNGYFTSKAIAKGAAIYGDDLQRPGMEASQR